MASADIVQIAAFDLDGTILDGESPLKLTTSLFRHRELPIHTALRMGIWGLCYRLRLPQTESTPRELLFSALTEQSVEEIDAEILKIYERRMRKCIRSAAVEEIERCRAAGMKLILASASFKPITTAIVDELKLDGHVSTIMEEKDNHYTGNVLGVPVQGREKLRLLVQYCDDRYGWKKWNLARAYSDHFSDEPMLSMADEAFVVDPDNKLKRIAKRSGWKVLDWDD